MTIKIGDKLPTVEFNTISSDGQKKVSTDEFFANRKVVLFAVPGAFTPTCNFNHIPGYVLDHDAILARGVEVIACTAVNDVHVLKAWAKATGAEGKIMMLSDGNGDFAKACGLEKDLSASTMGLRSSRYSMIVDNGVVKSLNIEEKSGVNVSGSETILTQL